MEGFEGEKRLNRETSELEVKGRFKLNEKELNRVSGGTQVGFVPIPCSVGDPDARARFTGQTMTPKASEIPSTLAPDAESSSGPLDLRLKSEYKDNFNMPNQVRWEHFDLER